MKSSAFLSTPNISSSSLYFVSNPIETERFIEDTCSAEAKVEIHLSISSALRPSVLGNSITNSSPPIRDTVPLSPQPLSITVAIRFNNSSPIACPKESFTSFNPLTSAINMVSGRFSLLSNLLSSSSKNLLLYNPVS